MRTGLDIFSDVPYRTGPVGLLSSAASLSSDGRTAFQALRQAGMTITTVFAPVDGYYGLGAVREVIPDPEIGSVPVAHLNTDAFAPDVQALQHVSALLIDLQEVGSRLHVFNALTHHTLIACAQARTPVILLDRPNPLSGMAVEGPLPASAYLNLFPYCDFPIRHGLTLGEMARWMNDMIRADLTVIPMEGWRRSMHYAEIGLPWSAPSPDIPHVSSALLFSAMRLLEGLPVNVGHGTLLLYEQFGAPFIDSDALLGALERLHLPGLRLTPAWFRPASGHYAGQPCEGVRLHIVDPRLVNIVDVGLHLIDTLIELYPNEMTWIETDGAYLVDMLMGTDKIRGQLDERRPIDRILSDCRYEANAFQTDSAAFWLYE